MIYKTKLILFRILFSSILILSNHMLINAAVKIINLMVEYTQNPIGIDVKNPRFSWQMIAPEGERDYVRSAYQIVITNPGGEIMWDSKKVTDDKSLNIHYEGSRLQLTTRYTWSVTVWDQNSITANESAWFETGLMNSDPGLSAWDSAIWIGGGDDDLVLYSPYLGVFKLNYTVQLDHASNTTRAGFVFGANDSRLLDKNKNIHGIENRRNESYIILELDISNVDGTENRLAQFHIYRVGYHPDDRVYRYSLDQQGII
jgi:alpha-L-rhamnosidase